MIAMMMLNTPAQKSNSILKSNTYSQLIMALPPFKETCSSAAEHLLKRYHCGDEARDNRHASLKTFT
jgi:hypothetical protein